MKNNNILAHFNFAAEKEKENELFSLYLFVLLAFVVGN